MSESDAKSTTFSNAPTKSKAELGAELQEIIRRGQDLGVVELPTGAAPARKILLRKPTRCSRKKAS